MIYFLFIGWFFFLSIFFTGEAIRYTEFVTDGTFTGFGKAFQGDLNLQTMTNINLSLADLKMIFSWIMLYFSIHSIINYHYKEKK